MSPRALVLTAPGTNREHEASFALEQAGARPEIVTIQALLADPAVLERAQMLVIAGGFSHADALGSGRLLALRLVTGVADALAAFVARGRPVLGICNGFQTLVRTGILPGTGLLSDASTASDSSSVALGHNESGRFECRWVTLLPASSKCVWTRDLDEPIRCPVAHGEGRFVATPAALDLLHRDDQVALTYGTRDAKPACGEYPANPNGSTADIAGICDASGVVLGLMPHPEDHIVARQSPGRARGDSGGSGLSLFINGVRHAKEL